MTIKIVTDSTCDLPQEVIRDLGITVIPLYINIGDTGYLDGVEITRKEFYANLPDYPVHPTTGMPGTQTFTEIYKNLVSEGATQILSLHISESLSATVTVAQKAAMEFTDVPVTVRDSQQLSTGTGFQVELAAQMANEGRSMGDIIQALDELEKRTFVTARLDTLDYLRRSGRMNAIMTGIGSLLQLKPILTMKNGNPGSERVRTSAKAEAMLEKMLKKYLPIQRFVLLHANAKAQAEAFRAKVFHLIPEGEMNIMDITPVIGAHIGPGAVGFAIVSKNPV